MADQLRGARATGTGTNAQGGRRVQLFSESESEGEDDKRAGADASAVSIIFQGNLIKSPPVANAETSTLKAWKRRWFVLYHGARWLAYFKNEFSFVDGGRPKGVIDLKECGGVTNVAPPGSKYPNLFSLMSPKRTYYLSAPSAEASQAWIAHLAAALSSAPGQPAGSLGSGAFAGTGNVHQQSRTLLRAGRSSGGAGAFSTDSMQTEPSSNSGTSSAAHAPSHTSGTSATDPHVNEPWYYGRMGRAEAEAELRAAGLDSGAFLVRKSDRATASFVLSILIGHRITHCQILHETPGFRLKVVEQIVHYPTLAHLVSSPEVRTELERALKRGPRRADR